MIYKSARDWTNATHKRVALFGMSGLGKTHLATALHASGTWFHYNVDYRIGTRYMGDYIVDNLKHEALKNPFLAGLLRSDSIDISSNISFNDLAPLSSYMGKPGDLAKGGLAFEDYMQRQDQHRTAEINALSDTGYFVNRSHELYKYDNFICDTGGSICEVVDPEDPNDPVLRHLSDTLLLVWIKGSEAHSEQLVQRFNAAPKPMYYPPEIMRDMWRRYLDLKGCAEAEVDPNDFIRWGYGEALSHRQPRYRAMAKNWGVTVTAEDVAKVATTDDFNALIANAIAAAG
ncbi:ATPase [Marinosulfonomonas sp. PRT-SC04]|nr:ATPase [Marinosulfonomonas sp. PRT-SC04]